MRIKVNFKKAAQMLDELIKEGLQLMEQNVSDYVHGVSSNEAPGLDVHVQRGGQWLRRCKATLGEIYEDFTPVYLFDRAQAPVAVREEKKRKQTLRGVEANVKAKMEVLIELYRELAPFSRSPLIYLKEKAQIVYYSRVIQLKPDVNESDLCRFLFEKAFGEWVEVSGLYEALTGEEWMGGSEQANLVVNAARGINKKTKEGFGFSIFKLKKKESICLILPPKFMDGDL